MESGVLRWRGSGPVGKELSEVLGTWRLSVAGPDHLGRSVGGRRWRARARDHAAVRDSGGARLPLNIRMNLHTYVFDTHIYRQRIYVCIRIYIDADILKRPYTNIHVHVDEYSDVQVHVHLLMLMNILRDIYTDVHMYINIFAFVLVNTHKIGNIHTYV